MPCSPRVARCRRARRSVRRPRRIRLARAGAWGSSRAATSCCRSGPRADTTEVDLYGLAKDLRADALVGRVGLSGDGNSTAEDADPFRFRSWLFGSVGQVSSNGFESIRERLLESVPDFLRRNIRGKSPSEHIFHLFLAFLHDAGILDQPSPPLAAAQSAVRNSVVFLDRLLAGTGSEPMRIALVATNGRCFVATSCAFPMQYLDVEGISDCPVCHGRPPGDSAGGPPPPPPPRRGPQANPPTAGGPGRPAPPPPRRSSAAAPPPRPAPPTAERPAPDRRQGAPGGGPPPTRGPRQRGRGGGSRRRWSG